MSTGFNGRGADGNTTFLISSSEECADVSIVPFPFFPPVCSHMHMPDRNIQTETASPSPYAPLILHSTSAMQQISLNAL